jgi:HPt (histidine-containing phosphotransfer) domain-containing protein
MQHSVQGAHPASQRRALVVEEHDVYRELAVSVLCQLDYQAEMASSAADALARIGQERFALVLLSSTLPGMGPELIAKLHALAEPGSLAIVMVHPEGEAAAGGEAGVLGHLSRPISGTSLKQLIDPPSAAPVHDPTAEPIVDIDHLLSFTDGDLELESELSILFLSSAEAYFDKMSRSLQSDTPWTKTAHALKGASANLGARRLAAMARSAEHQPPSAADLEAIRQAIDEVGAFFAKRQRAHGKVSGH